VKAIADTGFLVAFGSLRDQHHDWAVELADRADEPLLTCEAVLAEAAFNLRNTAAVMRLLDDGLVRIAFNLDDHRVQIAELARRYADREPDLADLCVVRMSELHPRHDVITVDRADFRVYRRNKREVIPLICPPQT